MRVKTPAAPTSPVASSAPPPITRPQPEQDGGQGQIDGAEQIIGDDLKSRGFRMGSIGRSKRYPSKHPGSQPLDVKKLVKIGREGGGDGQQALSEHNEAAAGVKAEADYEGEVGATEATLTCGHSSARHDDGSHHRRMDEPRVR